MSTEASILLPPQGQRILVIMAYPDDAEHCHASQMNNPEVDEFVRQRARVIGIEHGYTFGESFHHMALR